MQRYYSGIFWHFTGAPSGVPWQDLNKPSEILDSERVPKPDKITVEIVKKILKAKKLIASCAEKIDDGTDTAPFCCVTDIPLKDLPNFSQFYGRSAIGFHHPRIHQLFFPVTYMPRDHLPQENSVGVSEDELDSIMNPNPSQGDQKLRNKVNSRPDRTKLDESQATPFALNRMKFTEFSVRPEETFYSEREWRRLGSFEFESSDVAALVVPQEFIPDVRKFLDQNGFESTSLIAFEIIELA